MTRALLGADLRRGANGDLIAKWKGKPSDPDMFRELSSSLHGRFAQVETKTKRDATNFVRLVLGVAVVPKGDRKAFERARDLIEERIEDWIDDPETADLTIPEGYFS